MESILLRPATISDAEKITNLYRYCRFESDKSVHEKYARATKADDSFYDEYSLGLKAKIESGNAVFVVERNDDILGFAVVAEADDYGPKISSAFSKAVELHQIYVLPDEQDKGLGKLLFEQCIKQGKETAAEVMLINVLGTQTSRNEAALDFYRRMGAEELGIVVEHKERGGETHRLDCVVMGLDLEDHLAEIS